MNHDSYSDDYIKAILEDVKTIAVVGVSQNAARPSHAVFRYLRAHGYRVIGVNPGLGGQEIDGAPVYASLADVPEPIDMVDVFRNSEAAGEVVAEALKLPVLPKVIWMQLEVRNDYAAAAAEAKGLRVVMNRCPKIEHARLMG